MVAYTWILALESLKQDGCQFWVSLLYSEFHASLLQNETLSLKNKTRASQDGSVDKAPAVKTSP